MNRRPTGSLSLAKAISGFLQYKAAEGLSPNTLQSYQRDLKHWQIYAEDVPVHNPIHSRLPVDLPAYLPARREICGRCACAQ